MVDTTGCQSGSHPFDGICPPTLEDQVDMINVQIDCLQASIDGLIKERTILINKSNRGFIKEQTSNLKKEK